MFTKSKGCMESHLQTIISQASLHSKQSPEDLRQINYVKATLCQRSEMKAISVTGQCRPIISPAYCQQLQTNGYRTSSPSTGREAFKMKSIPEKEEQVQPMSCLESSIKCHEPVVCTHWKSVLIAPNVSRVLPGGQSALTRRNANIF